MSPQLLPLVYPWAARARATEHVSRPSYIDLLCLCGSMDVLYGPVLLSMSTTGAKAAPGRIAHATDIVSGG
jgi:hypothetical protein